ncbi:TetR family transcriptional regulator [Streptomyces sp. NPDC048057]|uniref:TetR family transcriptional regulator n=1 Tax=Streptomyces sp. NPDC048057 TaxID=3155628 RepID=UPI0033E77771
MTVEPAEVAGLRERKKQRTRYALARAALELFTTQGFDETTVDEIAEVVDVSQRTFFRYYASKEEAAFAVQEVVERSFVDALRARPPREAPFTAMRRAVLAAWDGIGETVAEIAPVDLHMRSYLLIESTPALLAVHIRRSMETEEKIASLIAEREGIDVDEDPRARVAVAAFSGAMRVAGRWWSEGEDHSPEAIRDLTARCMDQLGPALMGSWRADAPQG